jgi:hypothetical protein
MAARSPKQLLSSFHKFALPAPIGARPERAYTFKKKGKSS